MWQWHNLVAACGAAAWLLLLPQLLLLLSAALPFQAEVCTLLLTKRKKMCTASWQAGVGRQQWVRCSIVWQLGCRYAARCSAAVAPSACPLRLQSVSLARAFECACASIASHLAGREGCVGACRVCGLRLIVSLVWRRTAARTTAAPDIVVIFVACCMLQT